jgi:hypothetical protein
MEAHRAGELAAGRLLVHRLLCEFTGTEYDEQEAGVTWRLRDSGIIFVDDQGAEVTIGDLMYTVVTIMASLITTCSVLDPDTSPLDLVEAIGLGVAGISPET